MDISCSYDRVLDLYTQGNLLSQFCPTVSWNVVSTPPLYARRILYPKILLAQVSFSDSKWNSSYSFQIAYYQRNKAIASLVFPYVMPNADIHLLYADSFEGNELCLFFPNEFSYGRKLIVSHHIIPACRDWVVNYEYWKVNNNKWLGNQYPHGLHKLMETIHTLKTGKTDLFFN